MPRWSTSRNWPLLAYNDFYVDRVSCLTKPAQAAWAASWAAEQPSAAPNRGSKAPQEFAFRARPHARDLAPDRRIAGQVLTFRNVSMILRQPSV